MIETDDIKVLCIPVTDKKEVGFQIIYHEYENDNAPCAFFLTAGHAKDFIKEIQEAIELVE